mgnify:CR=1 FL=1
MVGLALGGRTGDSAIEQIAHRYGSQAVVISIDPRRVYVASPDDTRHHTVRCRQPMFSTKLRLMRRAASVGLLK